LSLFEIPPRIYVRVPSGLSLRSSPLISIPVFSIDPE